MVKPSATGGRNRKGWVVLAVAGVAVCLVGLSTLARDLFSWRRPSASALAKLREKDAADEPSPLPQTWDGKLEGRQTADFNIAPLPADSVAHSRRSPVRAERPVAVKLAMRPEDSAAEANLALLQLHFQLLQQGRERFARTPGYLATFVRRERIGSVLLDPVSMQIKVRHSPFSVYLKWLSDDPGKELLYVEGTNDGQMLVRLGGFKGKILPAFNVDPLGSLAMSRSRYPVQNIKTMSCPASGARQTPIATGASAPYSRWRSQRRRHRQCIANRFSTSIVSGVP
jgi:Protein of unknown function (DUF1571)